MLYNYSTVAASVQLTHLATERLVALIASLLVPSLHIKITAVQGCYIFVLVTKLLNLEMSILCGDLQDKDRRAWLFTLCFLEQHLRFLAVVNPPNTFPIAYTRDLDHGGVGDHLARSQAILGGGNQN